MGPGRPSLTRSSTPPLPAPHSRLPATNRTRASGSAHEAARSCLPRRLTPSAPPSPTAGRRRAPAHHSAATSQRASSRPTDSPSLEASSTRRSVRPSAVRHQSARPWGRPVTPGRHWGASRRSRMNQSNRVASLLRGCLPRVNPARRATAADAGFCGSTRITASSPPSAAAYWDARRTARVARPRPLQDG